MTRSGLRSNSTAPEIFPFASTILNLPNNPTMAAIPATTTASSVPEVWTVNPLSNNFNPGTASGSKIFLEKSKGPVNGERIGDTISESKAFMEFIKTKSIVFGPCVTHVPIEFDATGNPTKYANIIDQYQSLKLEDIQREAHKRFGTAIRIGDPIPASSATNLWSERVIDPAQNNADKDIFYNRVHGTVVAQCLNNTLTPTALSNLELSKHLFTFQDQAGHLKQDGPTMLYLVLLKIDPSTSVSIENHRKAIETTNMQKHNNDVSALITFIETHHKHVIANGGSYEEETLRRHSLAALASGPNANFNKLIESIDRDVRSGIGPHANIKTKDIFIAAERYYNNEVSEGTWTSIDPKDARIMALATEVENLKKSASSDKSTNKAALSTAANAGNARSGSTDLFFGVEKWRTENKGPSITRDGIAYNWCPHHKHPAGHYSGLYYKDHDSASHDEWKKTRRWNAKKGEADKTAPSSNGSDKKKLTIANELKTAFATNLCVSEEDLDKIIAKVNEQGN